MIWKPDLELEPLREIQIFNLIYHVCPFASTDRWKWNVDQLKARIHLFNGKKSIAIVTGNDMVPVDEVKEYVGGGFHFIVKENKVPDNQRPTEANTFWDLLETVLTNDQTEVTFFGHTKGVSKPNEVQKGWAEVMYQELLDYPERVKEVLASKSILGVDIKAPGPYLFAGTFWWFHNASLFSRDWQNRENTITGEGPSWAVEALPNKLFADDYVAIEHSYSIAGAT